MAVFAYIATDTDAAALRGTVVADTPRQARDQLRARGLRVQDVRALAAPPEGLWRWRPRRRHGADVVAFVRELSTLLAVGIPLLEALDTIAKQHRGRFRDCILLLRDRVAAGSSLADAMREQAHVFDDLCVSIAEVGESAGTLETSLEQLADFRERAANLRNRVTSALLYPALVLVMGVGVSLFLMSVVVPNLLTALLEAGRPLPFSTRVVKAASDLLIGRWWLLLLIAGGVVMLASALLRTSAGRRGWHRLELRLPVLGQMIRKQAIVRICLVVSTLLKSGLPFVRAVQIAQRGTANTVLRDALQRCQDAVLAGRDIAESLEDTGAFPPTVVQIFAVGQQSGRLEEMLDRLAADYDRQVAVLAGRLTAILEPALIVLLAVLVGFMAFATVLPILEAGNVL